MDNFNSNFVGARSDTGPIRKANEDAFWVSRDDTPTDRGALYVVADGVGGQVHGAAAAQKAVEVINKAFYEARDQSLDIPTAMKRAILRANQAIFEQAQDLGGGKMGCTIVVAVQHQDRLHVAHVGDARAYLVFGNKLRRLTKDDTWVQRQVEAGIITAEDAANHELRNVVTQVLGNKAEIDVHLAATQELSEGDTFLLSSDGMHGAISGEQIFRTIKGHSPQAAADRLVEAAIEAETTDNVTAVVVGTSDSAPMYVDDSVEPEWTSADTMAGTLLEPVDPPLPLVESPASAAEEKYDEDQFADWFEPQRPAGIRPPLWAIVTVAIASLLVIGYLAIRILGGNAAAIVGPEDSTQSPAPPTAAQSAIIPSQSDLAATRDSVAAEKIEPAVEPDATTAQATRQPPAATPAPSPTRPLWACAVGPAVLFVWSDEQVRSNTCNHTTNDSLQPGAPMLVLDENAISVSGPDAACVSSEFVKVSSVENPDLQGWVLQDSVRYIQQGEACNP